MNILSIFIHATRNEFIFRLSESSNLKLTPLLVLIITSKDGTPLVGRLLRGEEQQEQQQEQEQEPPLQQKKTNGIAAVLEAISEGGGKDGAGREEAGSAAAGDAAVAVGAVAVGAGEVCAPEEVATVGRVDRVENDLPRDVSNVWLAGGFGPCGIMEGPMAAWLLAKTISDTLQEYVDAHVDAPLHQSVFSLCSQSVLSLCS